MGRATANAELRHTQTGTPVTSFTLAVDRGYKDEEGNRQVDFLDVSAWKGNAEFASKYVTKGRQFAVVGKLQTRTWTDKEGNKRKTVEVVADNIYFADSKKADNTTESEDNPY
jgi:single-strand DNA-binding protein